MPEVIFPGPEGRLEGRFHPGTRPRAPVALILHSHPQAGGTMNNKIVQLLYQTYVKRGFATLRFNFRGVGKSQGTFDNGIGELSDAASALDWVQQIHPEAETTWVAGVSFGAWIGMQLLMRRPEIRGFISIAPPANMYDFSFLAPCPSSGIIIQGEGDEVVTPSAVQKLVDKLRTQRHITIHHDVIPGANHFFANELDLLMKSVDDYLDMRLATDKPAPAITKRSSQIVQIRTFITRTAAAPIIRKPRPRSSLRRAILMPPKTSRKAAIIVMAINAAPRPCKISLPFHQGLTGGGIVWPACGSKSSRSVSKRRSTGSRKRSFPASQ